jgi:YjbE family integral membrane protein
MNVPIVSIKAYIGLDDCGGCDYVAGVPITLDQISALVSVLIIDIVLAGDNAIVVGLAAASLPPERRGRVIFCGIIAAMVLRILFAFVAVGLLQTVVGILVGGGLLLLWVCWKMYRELRETQRSHANASTGPCTDGAAAKGKQKTPAQAMLQITLADLSMSLDNVLAVAGVAREHPTVLVLGLLLSVALMGVASTYIARLLARHFWIAWVGLGIITFVALRMIWDGVEQVMQHPALF